MHPTPRPCWLGSGLNKAAQPSPTQSRIRLMVPKSQEGWGVVLFPTGLPPKAIVIKGSRFQD